MKKILTLWIIIAFILVGGLTYIGLNLNLKNKPYLDLEKKLLDSAKDYYAQYPDKLPSDEAILTVDNLLGSNFLENFNNDEECTGYVLIKKNYVAHEFKSYIKCSDYETKKYDTNKESGSQ